MKRKLTTLNSFPFHPHLFLSPAMKRKLTTLNSFPFHPHPFLSPAMKRKLTTINSFPFHPHPFLSPAMKRKLTTINTINSHPFHPHPFFPPLHFLPSATLLSEPWIFDLPPSFWKTAFRVLNLSKLTLLYSSSSVTITGSPETQIHCPCSCCKKE